MPRLTEDERNRLFCMLHGGASVSTIAKHFNATRRAIYVTRDQEITIGSQNDRPRTLGRRKTTVREDNFIRQSHLPKRFKTEGQARDELKNIRIVSQL